jgi:Kef-type K+ transport system membrane component KefB
MPSCAGGRKELAFPNDLPLLVALVGITVILAILIKVGLNQAGVPSLVGFLGLGFLLRLGEDQWGLLSTTGQDIFAFLADIGLICLLFRVGLQSHLSKLIQQLRRASIIWLGNIAVSGALGFGVAYYALGFSLITSLFVAIALTATSIGIAISAWQDENVLDSPNGELLLDVAEMDDISAVLLMALLFALVPGLQGNNAAADWGDVIGIVGSFLLKAGLFGAFCYGFSSWFEPPLTRFFRRLEPPPDFTLTVVGIGFVIAAIAGLLGFSEAIGAFFAGLVFSRDPLAVKILASFDTVYDLFVPFFFVGIGLRLSPQLLPMGLNVGVVLLGAAVLGKLLGTGLPALLVTDWQSSTLLSLSMVPRAEIALVVMQHGYDLNNEVVPASLLSGMIFVTAVTSLAVPLLLRPLLKRWPQT